MKLTDKQAEKLWNYLTKAIPKVNYITSTTRRKIFNWIIRYL